MELSLVNKKFGYAKKALFWLDMDGHGWYFMLLVLTGVVGFYLMKSYYASYPEEEDYEMDVAVGMKTRIRHEGGL